ncbi:MAG: 4Fe-4S binding protein [Rhodospirillales bacterium]|nr:4Fe-4S binding protein [Rhodospirillales bacterium]
MSAETKINPLTLSRIRLFVQLVMLVVTVYGGAVMGHYLSDKISNELPALSCVFDQENGAYCTLLPIQHQLHHRVGEGIVRLQGFTFSMLIPIAITLLTFYAFFVFLNKAFCGWVCPLGTVQEVLYKVGRFVGLPVRRLAKDNVGRVRPAKWMILGGLVIVLPLLAGLGVAPHAAGDAYCQVCPSRILTTLMTGSTEQMAVPTSGWVDMMFAALRNAIFGFVIIAAFAVRQPFCRVCPMLALHALFRRLSPMRLVKKPHEEKCGKCGLCAKACPMDIHEIADDHGHKAFHEDCTLCGRCAEFCPDDDIIQLKFGPVPLFRSSSDYFRNRTKIDKPDGDLRKPTRKPEGAEA